MSNVEFIERVRTASADVPAGVATRLAAAVNPATWAQSKPSAISAVMKELRDLPLPGPRKHELTLTVLKLFVQLCLPADSQAADLQWLDENGSVVIDFAYGLAPAAYKLAAQCCSCLA